MQGEKFVLASRGILGGLAAAFGGAYLLITGQPASPEDVAAVEDVATQTGNLIAGAAALVGGVLAIIGRWRASKSLSVLPQ